MMKVRTLNIVGSVFIAAALSGCVSYGNTHALITPVGAVGYHKFKPENTAPQLPPSPDRVAAIQEQNDQQQHREGET
ncbi:hypothetical protein ACFPN2_00145 [Steroidobacter flavus]|uniref:Lipoprotein n=1 Tax=Steroidobacter flavus TaxID=1842136 RepID=A0ABV8SJ32_9GAMM